MAKWGEGDPRWIVEERPDATNVNNWHWTEKNATNWSIENLKNLFNNCPIKNDKANIVLCELEKVDGEASLNCRKGKIIHFFEWDLVIKWKGSLKDDSENTYNGTVKIPNLSDENNVSDLDITVIINENDEKANKLKEIMFEFGRPFVRQQLSKYISDLKETFGKNMLLPKANDAVNKEVKDLTSGFNKKVNMIPLNMETKKTGIVLDVSTVELTEQFQCKAQEVYDALTRIEMVSAFTRAQVKLDPTKGGKFELFGGNIIGHFEELIPARKIVQKWRYKQWPSEHFSTVTINISEKNDHTEIKLIQKNVPKSEVDVTKENWQRYYWDPMKRTFGFGSFIL